MYKVTATNKGEINLRIAIKKMNNVLIMQVGVNPKTTNLAWTPV